MLSGKQGRRFHACHKARIIPHAPEEEHVLRRLGKTVAVHWDAIPELTRVALFHQAVMMEDEYQTVQLKEQIQAFIDKHRTAGSS